MSSFSIYTAQVMEVEDDKTRDGYDGLRVRAAIATDDTKYISIIPWAFPLLPKTIQTAPKTGETVFVIMDDSGSKTSQQRYYIGPLISQPQFFAKSGKGSATSLLENSNTNPIAKISNVDETRGSFPNVKDVALIGRGREDVVLKYDEDTKASELDLRAGIRSEPTNSNDKNIVGNVIFNGVDPAYIQLKYKKGIAKQKNNQANSVINMVANRINIMSNKDNLISDNLKDKETLVSEEKMDEVMNNLHQVPMGDKLVELLKIIKGCIMHHVHPWAGMEQCGDWAGFIKKLEGYDIDSILSEYVRIS